MKVIDSNDKNNALTHRIKSMALFQQCGCKSQSLEVTREGQCQWGSLTLVVRPAAEGKNLFLYREVLVLIDRSLLPEGSDSNRLYPGWEGPSLSVCWRVDHSVHTFRVPRG